MVKKKILLINPSNPRYNKRLLPPLSLTTIAAYIPQNYDIEIVDNNLEKINYNADLVAITVNTYTARIAYEISKKFLERNIPVILGGNHPTIVPNEAIKYCTAVVIGDGELVWKQILKDFESRRLKKWYKSGFFNFEYSKLPRRDLLQKRYFLESIETLRGCPFNCEFCSVTRFHGGRFRFKPLDFIEKELESLNRKNLFIVDDNLIGAGTTSSKRIIDLLRLIKDYDLTWMAQASLNIADEDIVLRLAQESGCTFLFLGFESINKKALASFNKNVNLKRGVESYKNIIDKIHDYGIDVMGSFIIGSDFDTKKSIYELRDFIHDSGIDIPNITMLTPYPGTRLYEKLYSQERLFNNSFWLEEPPPLIAFKPKNLNVHQLLEIYYDLIISLNDFKSSFRRFLDSFIRKRSIKNAAFSLAESLITGRIFKKVIKENL
ncbi:MAG: B12-binding domain-containing radical SAM protein [Promethearchaeati archaeon]